MRALATIEEKAEGTKQALGQINDKLLAAALTKATTEAAASTPAASQNPEFVERVVERAREIVETSSRSPNARSGVHDRKAQRTFLDKRGMDAESKKLAIEALNGLQKIDLATLKYMAHDLADAQRSGNPGRAGLGTINRPKELYDNGLVTRLRVDWSRSPVFRFTPLGEDVAFLLLARDADTSDGVVKRQRANLREWDIGMRKMEDEMRRADEAVPIEDGM